MTSSITSRTFDGIEFIDERIDHNVTGYDAIPKMLAEAFGTTAGDRLPLDPQLGELVRLLMAVNARCSYCSILHAQEARKLGISAPRVDGIAAWRESALYSPDEAAAFAYAEALSQMRRDDVQAASEALAERFDQQAIEALLMVVVNMDVWTRIYLARGHHPHPTS